MKTFKTQDEMINQYAEDRLDAEMLENTIKGIVGLHTKEWIQNKREVLKGVAHQIMKYSPIYYIGGFVISGYGYTTERIGKYGVSESNCGNPALVRK